MGAVASLDIAIILIPTNRAVWWLTLGILCPAIVVASFWNPLFLHHRQSQGLTIALVTLLVLVYSDRVLAAASGNWLGSPTDADT